MRSLLRFSLRWWHPGQVHQAANPYTIQNVHSPVCFAPDGVTATVCHVIVLLMGVFLSIASLTALAGPPDAGFRMTSPGPTPTHCVFLALIQSRYYEPPPPLEVTETGWLRPKPEFNPCLWGSHILEDDSGTIKAWIRSDVITDWDLYEDRYVRVWGAADPPIGWCPLKILVTAVEVLQELTPTPMPTGTPTPTPTTTPTFTPTPPD